MSAQELGSWKQRRRFMWVITLFCMAVIGYCVFKDRAGSVAELAVEASFWCITAIMLFYVFGATMTDIMALRGGFFARTTTTSVTIPEQTEEEPPAPTKKKRRAF